MIYFFLYVEIVIEIDKGKIKFKNVIGNLRLKMCKILLGSRDLFRMIWYFLFGCLNRLCDIIFGFILNLV